MKESIKDWRIDDIENITEEQAKEMAIEEMQIKEHNIYFVEFGGCFGYSMLVFKDNHHIHYVNDYNCITKEIRGAKARQKKNCDNGISTEQTTNCSQKKNSQSL